MFSSYYFRYNDYNYDDYEDTSDDEVSSGEASDSGDEGKVVIQILLLVSQMIIFIVIWTISP